MHTDYFEGVLQLRTPTGEVLDFVEHEIKEHGRVRITNQKSVADGVDLYMTDRRFLTNLGKKLSARFGGQLKVAPRLFSKDRMTSCNIYRVNVLFRMPAFSRGAEIKIGNRSAKILSVKKIVQLQDVKTGKRFTATFGKVLLEWQRQH